MDFEKLALEYMEIIHQLHKRKAEKQINASTHGEQFVLFYISKHEGNVIPSKLSKEMGISTARVAATLNNLEEKDFITRRIDVDDRRRILVNLTDVGREQVKQQYRIIMNVTTKMLQYLGEDDANEFLRIMKRLADRGPENFL